MVKGADCKSSQTVRSDADLDGESRHGKNLAGHARLGVPFPVVAAFSAHVNPWLAALSRSYREEVLDAHLLDSLDQVREITEAWLETYNTERPHESLGQVPPLISLPRGQTGGVEFRSVYLTGKLTLRLALRIVEDGR